MGPNWEKETNRNWMRTKLEKPPKPVNTVDVQCEDRVRRQLAIDPTADALRQQRANGMNLKDNTGVGDKVMEFQHTLSPNRTENGQEFMIVERQLESLQLKILR
ncbi:MAG: hypothetical protein EZS28_005092 [Streblomastix strix]|uniref:Uncharacterized protein n=1 Tax=Streblomastix strix TaxID=222440 RepID=A0A5J4WXS9_9EUKA|nr:MAG: hypothetical protein EZS28_005092 [Streblomastix strix]